MLKILLSAYACEPGKGSEPGVGWNWVEQMSQFHQVWVITRANNRAAIESTGLDWVQRVHWVYYDLPDWLRFWKKGGRGVQAYYYLWQIGAYFKVRGLLRNTALDLIHHVTFGKFWIPSWLGLLPIPLIFGPVGGGEDAPPFLRRALTARQRRFESLRDFARAFFRCDPVLRRTLRHATVVSATKETAAMIEKYFRPSRTLVMPQVGVSKADLEKFALIEQKAGGLFRLISIGRLVHWKGYHLAIKAFAQLLKTCPAAEYWLVSSGPERSALEALAQSLGCGEQVKFWGRLPTLDDVYAKLEESDALVHPALHEAFGNACLEAMAAGRPVICLNEGGPGLQVTPETGIAIDPGTEEQTVTRLAQAMARLAEDPGLATTMGSKARHRASEQFSWEEMARRMDAVYREVLAVQKQHANSSRQ